MTLDLQPYKDEIEKYIRGEHQDHVLHEYCEMIVKKYSKQPDISAEAACEKRKSELGIKDYKGE